jgi:hypothetical protein
MKSYGPAQSVELPTRHDGVGAAWSRFWFTPADPTALHVVRVLTGLLFLFWLLPFAGHVEEFFTFNGWFDREGYLEISRLPPEQRPSHLGWSLLYAVGDDVTLVHAVYLGTIGVLVLFTLGVAPRVMAVLTWVLIVSFVSFLAGPVGRSEDDLFQMLAFYLMVGYVLLGQFTWKLTPLQRILGVTAIPFLGRAPAQEDQSKRPSHAANLALRLFQVNFAMVMVASCFHKMGIGDWWSGVGFWYPLHPPFESKPADIHNAARHAMSLLFVHSLAQYLFVAWQLTFPIWAWRRSTFFRSLLVGGGVIGFLGCIWIYQMPAIGAFYLVGCLAFISSEEWHGVAVKVSKFWQKQGAREMAKASSSSRTPVAV